MAFHSLKAVLVGVTVLATAANPGPQAPARTCIKVEQHHLDFQITSLRIKHPWGYPNISSGWESNIDSCSGVNGACFRYPVQEKYDGMPVTSVATGLNPGVYNAAYDIWFNKTDAHPSQDDGTEIMIWTAHPGIDVWDIARQVTIDGIHWTVMTWTAHNSTAKKSWHYVAYVAEHQRSSVFGLRLNPFFRDAIANRELSGNWWLTGIDFGFELVSGGLNNDVHFYKLTGVRWLRVSPSASPSTRSSNSPMVTDRSRTGELVI